MLQRLLHSILMLIRVMPIMQTPSNLLAALQYHMVEKDRLPGPALLPQLDMLEELQAITPALNRRLPLQRVILCKRKEPERIGMLEQQRRLEVFYRILGYIFELT